MAFQMVIFVVLLEGSVEGRMVDIRPILQPDGRHKAHTTAKRHRTYHTHLLLFHCLASILSSPSAPALPSKTL